MSYFAFVVNYSYVSIRGFITLVGEERSYFAAIVYL